MNIAIIGAGITGLSAAYELTKKGHAVTVFERSSLPGGLGTYTKIGGTHIESFYHHFFTSDTEIIRLAEELGLKRKLKYYHAKTGIFKNDTVFPFASPRDLINFSLLPFLDRVRCGFVAAFCKIAPPLSLLDKMKASTFIKIFGGQKVLRTIWRPLLRGKFAQYAQQTPALWLWGRIHDRSKMLGYFDGSVKVLFDALLQAIEKRNGNIFFNSDVSAIRSTKSGVTIVANGKNHRFDAVLITVVSPVANLLIKSKLPKTFRKKISRIDHLGAICVIATLDRPLQSQYWLNVCEDNAEVLVVVEQTNMIAKRCYSNKSVLYLANYVHRTEKEFHMTDGDIIKRYMRILQKINPAFQKHWIKSAKVARVPRAQTIFGLDSLRKLPPTQTPDSRIFLANIDQMYPHDRNLNQGVFLGKKAAETITDT